MIKHNVYHFIGPEAIIIGSFAKQEDPYAADKQPTASTVSSTGSKCSIEKNDVDDDDDDRIVTVNLVETISSQEDDAETVFSHDDHVELMSSQEEQSYDQQAKSLTRDIDVSSSESVAPKKKKLRFPETDTEDETGVFDNAMDALEDQTSVPDDSAPDENSSQGWSQDEDGQAKISLTKLNSTENNGNTAHDVSVQGGLSGMTASKKRRLSFTRDKTSKSFHMEKRPCSRIERLKTAINDDHPHASIHSNCGDDSTDEGSSQRHQVRPKSSSQLIHRATFPDIVIPDTDDEKLEGDRFQPLSLAQEDIDFWQEQAAENKASTSSKGRIPAMSRRAMSSFENRGSTSNPAKKKVHFDDLNLDNTSKKVKSLKSSSQPSRKLTRQASQASQSSQNFVASSSLQ